VLVAPDAGGVSLCVRPIAPKDLGPGAQLDWAMADGLVPRQPEAAVSAAGDAALSLAVAPPSGLRVEWFEAAGNNSASGWV